MQFQGKDNIFNAQIRELRDLSDCEQVVSCLRSAFGDSYIKPQMYSPDEVLRMQRSGEIHLYLAVTEDGSAAGIMGWEQLDMFPRTAELCTLVVRGGYEGAGLGEALIRHAYDIVRGLDVTSVFSYPIASHFKAQRCIEKLGAVSCGFLPSVFSVERFSSGVEGHSNPKDSLAVVAFNTGKSDAGRLYLKKRYHTLAEKVYGGLSARFEAVEAIAPPACPSTRYEYRYDSVHSTLYINANETGTDFPLLVREIAQHKNGCFTAQLCLNMCDEAAVFAAELLENHGFFLTGFHPLCGDREYCIYHYRGGVEFDIDDLNYIDSQSDFAECIRKATI